MLDQDGNTVALMAEDEGSLGKGIGRQLLRTHRAFTATIFSPDGEKVSIFDSYSDVHLRISVDKGWAHEHLSRGLNSAFDVSLSPRAQHMCRVAVQVIRVKAEE